jgi:hypothetical protein
VKINNTKSRARRSADRIIYISGNVADRGDVQALASIGGRICLELKADSAGSGEVSEADDEASAALSIYKDSSGDGSRGGATVKRARRDDRPRGRLSIDDPVSCSAAEKH